MPGNKLNPRCQRTNRQDIFVDADGQWKPCTYVQSSQLWYVMKDWFIQQGFDPDQHNVRNMTFQEYKDSDAFKALHKSFSQENYPKCCLNECGTNAWSSDNDVDKWSPYKK